jgi:hypothetical protein
LRQDVGRSRQGPRGALPAALRAFAQHQQEIALYPAGVLKFVDQQQRDARASGARDLRVLAQAVARQP